MNSRASPIGRRSIREGVIVPVTVFIQSEGEKTKYLSCMVDVSVWGSRLKGRVPCGPGQIVEVSPIRDPIHVVSSKVVWVRKSQFNEESELGLEFLQPTPIGYWWGPADTPS